jgi:ATP-dependent HslUV protease ATP-binding subunit HslU
MEKLLEEVSFEAEKHRDTKVVVDAAYVNERLYSLSQSEDLARYVL